MGEGYEEMSQAMQWLVQPVRSLPQVALSWADSSAWRFGKPPRDASACKNTRKAPATRTKKSKASTKCTGPDDEEFFPSHKSGVLFSPAKGLSFSFCD
jgi:hypothetical protein